MYKIHVYEEMSFQFNSIQFNVIQVKIKAYTNQMTSTSMILNNFGTYNWHTNVLKLSQTNFGISWHNMFYRTYLLNHIINN